MTPRVEQAVQACKKATKSQNCHPERRASDQVAQAFRPE